MRQPRCRRVVQEASGIVARYGGEEFALLLPEVELKGAVSLADKTRRLIEKTKFEFDDEAIPVTISAGVATLGPKLDTPAALIGAADAKLYEAKGQGRNKVCF